MKLFKIFMLFLVATFAYKGATAQDASINILAGGGGIVTVGGSIFLQVDVTNNDATGIVVANKVRPQISAPTGISSISLTASDHTLPAGWTITSNSGSVIRITNTSDPIPAGVTRTAFIKINGGPSTGNGTILANLTFVGAAPTGDNTANNSSSAGLTTNPAAACTLGVTAAAGTIACNGGTTTLTATPTGAAGTVEYSITGGAPFQAGNTFTVPAGTYTVTAREVANPTCTATATAVIIGQPTAVTASGVVSTPIAVFGGTGSITVTAAGGTAGTTTYVIASGTTINTTGATTGIFTGLLSGTYTFIATKNGCPSAASAGVTLADPAACILTGVTASAGTILCNGGTTTLTATASPSGPTYEYSLNGGAYQSGNTFTVGAGTYTVTAREAANTGCTATSSSVTVAQPTAITASAAAGTITCGAATTTLTVTASGGTGALQYSLNGGAFQAGNTFAVSVGAYVVTVRDANNCTVNTTSVTVTSTPDNVNPTITAPAAVSACTNTGCTATGVMLGTPVTADNCTVASVTNNAPAAFPLGATIVTWTVTDGAGNTATATQTVTVTDGTAPSIYVNQTGLVAGTTGPSSSASPYILPLKNGVRLRSILTATDAIGGYQMSGIPDGLGAFDNCNGTFTVLMNHELGSTVGAARAHGGIGAFVSRWVINKSNLQVQSGSDLMQQVYGWNTGTQVSNAAPTTGIAFNRFCSADLPEVSAYFNPATGRGTRARIFMHGEEGGATGYQLGTVASGADAGKAYILGKFNLTTNGSGLTGVGAWENALANPFAQDSTIVIGNNDGGTGIMTNSVAVYIGAKTNTGTEVDKAGLTNGTLKFVNVAGSTAEIVNTTTRATNITSGTAFTLSATSSTTFSRPEDGVWNPANPAQYFFVTTDQYDQVKDGVGTQIGRSRLWRLNFTNIAQPSLGGTIDLLLDGTQAHNMFDNLTADKNGNLILQEDVGNQQHNGKMWQYKISNGNFVQINRHDPARFGDVGVPATAPFSQDEETSGVIDVSDILGRGMFLLVDQAHYTTGIPSNVVEGGQLLAMFNPDSFGGAAATAQDTVRACSGTGVVLGTPATADNCTVASVTNNAPATFPTGTTTVTWTVTDGAGNTATATQVVIVAPVTATAAVTTAITTAPGSTGTITVTAAGGTGAKTYVITSGTTINTTGATTGVFTGLAAGNYTFTVTDAAGCAATASVLLASPVAASADPAVGQMFFTTTGGAVQSANTLLLAPAADLYDINVPFYNLNQVNQVPDGTIRFTVNLGSKLVLAPGFNLATAPLSTYFTWAQSVVAGNVILTGTQIAAIPADFDAVAIFRVKGDSACRSNVVSNIVITNILQTLNDDDLQNNAATLQYTLPITLTNTQVNVTCSGAGNGIINGVVSSGTTVVTTGPAGYTNTQNIASGVNNFTLTGLVPGTYTITATASSDAPLGSCNQTISVIIAQPTVLTIPAASISKTNITCFGTATGSITVSAAGGTAPYTYTIAGPTVNTTGASSGIFTGLLAGSYIVTVTDNNGCTASTAAILITQPVGGIPDITLGSDITGSLFATPGVSQTIVYNIAEIGGNSAVGDTLRITKVAGFTINFNPTIFSTTVGATTYALDNPRWKIDNSNPSFVSIILTDPSNAANPGTLLCNTLVRVAVSITRNTSNISTFTLSARLRKANGEVNLANNLNSIIMAAD
jgi:SprB repeat/HYR domain